MNELIIHFLKPHLNDEAYSYSCKSFRAGLPSALAAYPNLEMMCISKGGGDGIAMLMNGILG
jgi:hypothetical protein